jgi:hypothetical protein
MNRRSGRREDRRERWQHEPGGAAREAGRAPWAGGDGDRCLAMGIGAMCLVMLAPRLPDGSSW